MKRLASAAAALLVSGLLFYIALRDVNLAQMAGALAEADPPWLPLLVLMPVVDIWVRALRWRVLLAPLAELGTRDLFQLQAVGLATNNILFLRLGELARGALAAQEADLPVVSVLATIFVERLCDTAALLVLFFFGAELLPRGVVPPTARFGALALSASVCAALALLASADKKGDKGPFARWLKPYPRLRLWSFEIMAGARCLRRGSSVCRVAALSLALWLADAGTFWAAGRTLRLSPELSAPQAIAVVAFAAAATALPAMPGAFGNFEAGVRYVLRRFGYPRPIAVGFAVLSHLAMYVVVTVLGLISLYALGHTLASLKKALRR